MIIYIIIKILLSYWLIFKLGWVKEIWKISLSADIVVLLYFIYFIYNEKLDIINEIFMYSAIIIWIFLLYKGMNYILNNEIEIIKKIIENEKIKKIMTNPWICKIVYYMIWMLPWNIGYWIYFWIQENGWYARVWFSSTRDIIFWKMFKWDSRNDFFIWTDKIIKNKVYKKIIQKKDKVIKVLYRVLFITYYIRKELLIIKISKYIWIRMIVYMYLSIFYICMFEELHIINKYLFYLLILLELLALYYMEEIINYMEPAILSAWEKSGINESSNRVFLYTFRNPFYWNAYLKWDWHVTFWDITLCNSISLNILYKYILYVNKNTKGYFDKQMNIVTRDNRIRLMGVQIETDTIIWSVLPATRYVIINLKWFGYEYPTDILYGRYYKINEKLINISNNKNLYLSFYEKTYSKTSLIMLIWILKINDMYWDIWWYDLYREYTKLKKDKNYYFFWTNNYNINRIFIIMYSLYILKYDKRLIKDLNMILKSFFGERKIYFNEEEYMDSDEYGLKNLVKNGNKLAISEKICGLRTYKKMFKIMGRIMWRKEETISWNPDLFGMLYDFKKTCIDIYYNENKKSSFDELTEQEQIIWNMVHKKIETLRGLINYPGYFIFDEALNNDLLFFSEVLNLENKDASWLYNQLKSIVEKITDKNFDISKLELEIYKSSIFFNNFIVNEKRDYLSIIYFILMLQYVYYQDFKLNSEIDEEEIEIKTLQEFFEKEERLKEYKDWKYFFREE